MVKLAEGLTTGQLYRAIERLPRVRLGHLPTPLEELPRFSEAIGGPRVFIKRDDCTGLVFGGNKTRHNEFLLADALDQGADMLVWGAGIQSNNCRQTAAGCARLGLDCHLLLSRATHDEDLQGNLLLDYLLGASYEIVEPPLGPQLDALIAHAADRFTKAGRKVYKWDPKRVKPLAAVSYAVCVAELVDQLESQGVEAAAVYVCSGGSTGAGMALGRAALAWNVPLRIVLPIRWPWDEQQDLARIAHETATLLNLPISVEATDIDVTGEFVGPGYGVPTDECMEAIRLLARTEGILLDPSYTGKAMAALIADARAGRYSPDQSVVFVHTGGTPALFAFRDELVEMIPAVRRE